MRVLILRFLCFTNWDLICILALQFFVMKHKIILLLCSLAFSYSVIGQSYQAQFNELAQTEQWEEMLPLLQAWQSADSSDVELYVAWFNYYFIHSFQEYLVFDHNSGTGEYMVLRDQLSGEERGFLRSEVMVNDSVFQLAINAIHRGLKLEPKRMDMHMGKIYALAEAGKLDLHVQALIALIDTFSKDQEGWLWSDGAVMEDAKQTFFGAIQEYNYALFQREEPYCEGIRQLSKHMIAVFGKNTERLANLGACHLFEENYKEALRYFEEAHQLDPKDVVVIANLANTYSKMNNKRQAIRYYELMAQWGNPREAQFAKQQIEFLKRK
jgi:tetratricopeptide (TPR) repeat protein